ncbi:hypothetical protein N431DRAFT_463313 [Stipitochalara longipes BDJ]|nr:hypothetical protein N431DRAFT_463313 [Stipitochalara longipes BDJ]
MEYPIPVALKSQNVCQSCRIGKQRCDKSLPSCSRCVSKLICCNYAGIDAPAQARYPYPGRAVGATTTPSLLHRRCCLDLSDHGARELLEAVRADNGFFNLAHLINRILEAAKITATSLMDEYFATIHTWLPIIDKDQFRSRLLSWPETGDAALSTLMWSFHLITRRPCADNHHSINNLLYRTTKQIFMLQASGDATLELLQAGLIVTYYACGHGLLQDAHVTLATCLAIAQLIGLDFEGMSDPSELDNERSACWWAIILLDRTKALSSLTNPMPLVLQPHLGFDTESPASYLASSRAKRSFDVSSRVALLIGTAVVYSNDSRSIRLAGSTYINICNQIEQLVRDLICMAKTGPDSYIYCESTSLAFCTLLALQAANPRGERLKADSKEVLLLQATLRMIQENLRMATILLQEERANGIPVVAICALSRVAVILVRLYGCELSSQDLDLLRSNLQGFSARWMICRKFLAHIDKIIA